MSRSKNPPSRNGTPAVEAANPVDTTAAMCAAIAAFIREHFPKSNAAALVVNPAHGLPPFVLAVGDTDAVPEIVGNADDHPRRN